MCVHVCMCANLAKTIHKQQRRYYMDEKWEKIRTKNNDTYVLESNSENHLSVCYPNNCKNKTSN